MQHHHRRAIDIIRAYTTSGSRAITIITARSDVGRAARPHN